MLFYALQDDARLEQAGRARALALVQRLGNGGPAKPPGTDTICQEAELSDEECEKAAEMVSAAYEGDWDKFLRVAAMAGAVYACNQAGLGWASGFCASIGAKIYEWIAGLFSGVGMITGPVPCIVQPRSAGGKQATVAGLRPGEYIIRVSPSARYYLNGTWRDASHYGNYYYSMTDCAFVLSQRVTLPWMKTIQRFEDGRPGVKADGRPNYDPCSASGERPKRIPDPNWFSWSKNIGNPTDDWNAKGTAWALINMIEGWKMPNCAGAWPSKLPDDQGTVRNRVTWCQYHRELSMKPCECWKQKGAVARTIMAPPSVQKKIGEHTFTTGRINKNCRFLAFKDWDGTVVEMDDNRNLKVTRPGIGGRRILKPGGKFLAPTTAAAPPKPGTPKPIYKSVGFWVTAGTLAAATVTGVYYVATR